MNARATDVERGMEVFGSDGEKLGTVAEVWPNTPYGHVPKSTTDMQSYGPIAGTHEQMETPEGFFEVRISEPVGVERHPSLFIPFQDVESVEEERVTLDVPAQTATERFLERPTALLS